MAANTGVLRGRQPGGRLVKDVAGSANIVLSIAEAMAEIITYTGALTGNITVTLPLGADDSGYTWVIDNQSSGAFTITTIGPSNAVGVAVPQGRKTRLGWNGATIFSADDGVVRHEALSIAQANTTDRTLTNAQYKCGYLTATGSPGGAFNWIVPTSAGIYTINNQTDQTMTVKTAAGTGVALTTGQAALLICDGTNVVGIARGTLITS